MGISSESDDSESSSPCDITPLSTELNIEQNLASESNNDDNETSSINFHLSNGETIYNRDFYDLNENRQSTQTSLLLRERRKLIPLFLLLYSLIAGFGLGMTNIFFPLYFRDSLNLSPIQVQTIYTIEPLLMASSFGPTRVLSDRVGRVQIMIYSKIIGVLALVLLCFCQGIFDRKGFLLVPCYLLHTTFVSATDPLEESLLMDFSPRRYRARWMSLDSIVEFGWAGSSIFGGIILDQYSYTVAILVSAAIQLLAVLILIIFLLPIVPAHESELLSTNASPADAPTSGQPSASIYTQIDSMNGHISSETPDNAVLNMTDKIIDEHSNLSSLKTSLLS